jgi:diguanylate cyclase (GGDEF)-like protein
MDRAKEYFEHIQRLMHDRQIPELPEELADDPLFVQIHNELKEMREVMLAFSAGNFAPPIASRGFISGCLKSLQAKVRHLFWQLQMIENGDFSQEVRFMGEFSTAFNNMVSKLRWSLMELQKKENALRESESRFKVLASQDYVTGIYNRRSFIELSEYRLTKAAGESVPCCLAMMDIDHFKAFNDTYGHLAGDAVLRHVVKIMEGSLRKDDFMGRYGGEEFVFFFYNIEEKTGAEVVDRLRKKLAETQVHLDAGPVSVYASFGVVGCDMENSKDDKEYVQKRINDADRALYAAKKAGRNRVMLYTPAMTDIMDSPDL